MTFVGKSRASLFAANPTKVLENTGEDAYAARSNANCHSGRDSMTTRTIAGTGTQAVLKRHDWIKIGLRAAVFGVAAVLAVQALTLAIWPEAAAFKPLDSYARSALFTLIPVLGATAVFAWLARKHDRPVRKFLSLSAIVLLLSFIPDYALPLPGKSLLASSIAASMHLVAGVTTVATIVWSYRRRASL